MTFDRQIVKISEPGIQVELFFVPWDSEIFGFPVAEIERITVDSGIDCAACIRQLRGWFDANDIRLATCRLSSDRLRESMLLEANGFRFVEMVYRPSLSPIPAIARIDGDLAISESQLEDLPALEAIAGGAFSTGRFLLDWRLDRKSSHRRYATWVRNSFEDPRQAVLKACLGGDIVGFFVVEDRPDLSAYWHLTAIATRWQGKGIGKRLWREMVARHHAAGQRRIDTTISAHNPSVMNIYAGLGFRFNSPQMTFHWVRQ